MWTRTWTREATTAIRERPSGHLASGDPRLSVEERYRTHIGYVAKVTLAANRLRNERMLLTEDVLRYIAEATIGPIGR